MVKPKKRKCKAGFSCGRSCIQRKRTCRSNLNSKGKKVVENYTQFINRLAAESQAKLINMVKADSMDDAVTKILESLPGGDPRTPKGKANKAIESLKSNVTLTENAARNLSNKAKIDKAIADLASYGEELYSAELDELVRTGVGIANRRAELMAAGDSPNISRAIREYNQQARQADQDAELAIANLRTKLSRGGMEAPKAFKNIRDKFGKAPASVKAEFSTMEAITNGAVSKNVKTVEELPGKGRSKARSSEGKIWMSPEFPKGVAAHEAMHVIEVNNEALNKFAIGYRTSRRNPDEFVVKSLNEIENTTGYRSNEMAFVGSYPDNYMGKIYPSFQKGEGIGSVRQPTEVNPVFVQSLFDKDAARHFAENDRSGLAAWLAIMELSR